MKKLLRLTVLTPAEVLRDVEGVRWVQAQLADGGGISIWPGHAPLLAETISAPLRYADDAGEQTLALAAGILQIDDGSVTIFTSGPAEADEMKRPFDGDDQPAEAYGRLARTLLAATLEYQKDGDE